MDTTPDDDSRRPAATPPEDHAAVPATTTHASSRPHWAARIEDAALGSLNAVLRRRGWVPRAEPYTGYGAPGWVRVLGRAVLAAPDSSAREVSERDTESSSRTVRGWRSFVSAQLAGAVVRVEIGDRTHEVTADRGGYVDAVVEADLAPGWHQVRLVLGGQGVEAPVLVIDPAAEVGMVSDVDDTVMVTALPRPLLAAWNAFVLHENARRVVPGMAGLYRRWTASRPHAPVFYLSTGAWNIAPALRRFLQRHGYPAGPLLLTDWGPTNTGWFRSGQAHKDAALRRLREEFPGMRWFLVGDDGQHDPEIYGQFAAEHPESVDAVAIRQLTPTEQVLAHGTTEPLDRVRRMTSAATTVTGPDGNALALAMIDTGLLET
ncbi:ACP synthase [Actinotalea ferrariae CF5-4]|uniref:ACP synthase n=1 Tax=Actinotalea ferrariae CF5-4 TaxID=948458 RepID=A0A021VSJ8_9CELL|nr:phosphatase domain-containing protein [Actinotalea ferrariae]EYR64136.1 ACP synthase [Actinotalea ferrariae CF5-4]